MAIVPDCFEQIHFALQYHQVYLATSIRALQKKMKVLKTVLT